MHEQQPPIQDIDSCWRCGLNAIALDEKKRPLCARHAMIFVSAPRMMAAEKQSRALPEDVGLGLVGEEALLGGREQPSSRSEIADTVETGESSQPNDGHGETYEISLKLYQTLPHDARQFLERYSSPQLRASYPIVPAAKTPPNFDAPDDGVAAPGDEPSRNGDLGSYRPRPPVTVAPFRMNRPAVPLF